ncbi:MAG: tyrosine-type recombinase/integrase [Lachnospiraceae bacterium]|nr:tyrosine-type recombinase/integrase [Lachnospiraceae bacterium]
MAKKKKGELPSGSIRRQVFVGYELVYDDQGKPVLDGNGKQLRKRKYKSITAASAKEAAQKAIEIKLARPDVLSLTDITFKEARERYIDSMRSVLSPSTIRGYSQMRTYFGDLDYMKVGAITSDMLQAWVNSFSATHSPKTVRNGYGLIVTVLSHYNINIKAKLPPKKVDALYIPTDADVQAIVQYFRNKGDTDMVIAICLASFATLRRSEICGLSADDVKGNIIHIHDSVVMDADHNAVRKDRVKNASSDRYIEIPEFVADLLPKEGMIVNISPDIITNRFGRGLKKAGIAAFRFHDLRHYSASIMHALGIPDVYIMERGGWKSDETLKKVYRGSIEDYKKKFVEQTNSYFENMQHECNTNL